MTRVYYLILNFLSNDGVFKYGIARVFEWLVPRPLIFLHFIHTGVDAG